MTLHGRVESMKLSGRVENGNVAVDLPEGTPVTIMVRDEDLPPGPFVEVDDNGDVIVTPELEAELDAAAAEQGFVSLGELQERLRTNRR